VRKDNSNWWTAFDAVGPPGNPGGSTWIMKSVGRASASDASEAEKNPVDRSLSRYIRTNPGQRFRSIVRASEAECGVSRATVARHLAKLVRFGDVGILPNRTYFVTGQAKDVGRPTVEYGDFSSTILIRSDGSSYEEMRRKFRVVSGHLGHFELTNPVTPHYIEWFSSVPARSVSSNNSPSSGFMSPFGLEFRKPITGRVADWQVLQCFGEIPRSYPMVESHGARQRPGVVVRTASAGIYVPSEGPRLHSHLSKDAVAQLQVLFPPRYPIGRSRVRVQYLTERRMVDAAEEDRLKRLSSDPWQTAGFRKLETGLILTVPGPLRDRRYLIEWTLPTDQERNEWLRSESDRLRSMVRSPPESGPRPASKASA
jgi:hypothetical protein